MPLSAKVAFRLVGGLNIALSAIGVYLMVESILRFSHGHQSDAKAPFWGLAFLLMSLINVLIITVLVIASTKLLRLTNDAVRFYCVVTGACVLYGFVNGCLWLAPDPIGRSIGAASGVGNMGVAPFESVLVLPFVYPILSASVLLVVQKRLRRVANAIV